jgi:hypothetical protein
MICKLTLFYILVYHREQWLSLLCGSYYKKYLLLVKMVNRMIGPLQDDKLTILMNGPIKKMLKIPEKVIWGGEKSETCVFH